MIGRASAVAAFLLLAGPSWANQIVQQPQSNVTIPGAIQDRPAAAMQEGPDERPLWRLLSAGQDSDVQARIGRLEADYPGWRPSGKLSAALARARAGRQFATAKAGADWPEIRRIAAAYPDIVACNRPDDAVVAAVAQADGQGPGGGQGRTGDASVLTQALAGCASATERLGVLAAAFGRLGAAPVADLANRFDAQALPAGGQQRLLDLRQSIALRLAADNLAAGKPDALAHALALGPAIEARQDAGLATALAWALLHAGRPQLAVLWFQTARRWDPAQPPEGLARAHLAAGDPDAALHDVEGDRALRGPLMAEIAAARIDAAFRRGAFQEVVALSAGLPDPPEALGWSLFRLRSFEAAAAAFEHRYARHHAASAAEGLLLSLTQLGHFADAQPIADRLGGPLRQVLDPASDSFYRFHLAWLRVALARPDTGDVARLAAALAAPVIARDDAAAATTLGWTAMAHDQLPEAAIWFARGARAADNEDARYGAAVAAYRLGDGLAAADAAAAWPASPRWRRLRIDGLMLQAQKDDTAGNPRAESLARAALALDPGRRDATLLLAWAAQRAGRQPEAAAAFEALYRAVPDAEAAAGLGAAAAPDRLAALADELGGRLRPIARRQAATGALAHKAFLAALRIDPQFDPALANFDTPTFGTSSTLRSRSGSVGTSRLETTAMDIYGTVTSGDDVWAARVHLIRLNSGPPEAGQITSRLPLGAEPRLAWERRGDMTPFADIGTTPIGGVVAPTPQGDAGMTVSMAGADVTGSIYRQSVTESVLSYTGVTDPHTGRSFGRVTETGVRLDAYKQIAPRWGLWLDSAAGMRTGVDVQSNTHLQAAVTLPYDMRIAGMDYLTLGPTYQFSRFDHDLSGFVPGQGGYYSPGASHVTGLALRFQTAESRDLIVLGSAVAGWQFAHSSGAATQSGGPGQGSAQNGFSATGQLTATYRLAGNWALGGLLRTQISPQYHDLYAGVALTFSFGARAALFSADLPYFDQR